MPSLLYANNSAPFWDFVASLEQQGSDHPFFRQNHDHEGAHEHEQSDDREENHGPPAWGWGQFFGGGGGMPHRGPPPQQTDEVAEKDKDENMDNEKVENNDVNDNGEGPSGHMSSENESRCHGRARHGRCSGRRGRCGPGGPGGRGGFGGPGAFGGPCGRGGFGPHHGPPRWGRARWGPWGRGGFGGGFDPSALAAHFWTHFNDASAPGRRDENADHAPDSDVFDTDAAFVVHVSVPGAKKEDVGVNWDADKSELSVAGVIYRPGDEEFLKTLAMDERKIGAFERKIRLGTRANPAHIDAEGITAKLEDGVLAVYVPKLDAGYVEIRKVDIE